MLESSEFVATRGSAEKKNAEKSLMVTIFESHKAKEKIVKEEPKNLKEVVDEPKQLNINKVKHEIIKFGMSGFDSQKKEEAKIQLAIKLGS